MIQLACDFAKPAQQLPHFWEHTVGSGHAPLALRTDWQNQLRRCRKELGFRHVRFHGILSDPMGTLICQNEELLYSFFNADQVFDFLLSIGVKPFVELSFMPTTLASGYETVFRYQGNITLPKDFQQWATLIRELVSHWVDRYGVSEVGQWFFEVWNEPNLHHFWTGTQADYFKLYRYTVEAIKGVDGSLKVGGPATAQNAWIADFLDFCSRNDLPVDFVTTHYYPTDAFGEIGADTETQLANIDPDVMKARAQKAYTEAAGKPLYYTEWNVSSNPRHSMHDQTSAAAFATQIIMQVSPFVHGYSFWTFSDIFEENYFPSIPFHGGFGLLNLHGIPKPVYHAFELLHRLGTELLMVDGTQGTVQAWLIRKSNTATLLVTNFALPRHPVQTELIQFHLSKTSEPRAIYIERIDQDHANPVLLWKEMGEPKYLTDVQTQQLRAESRLLKEVIPCHYQDGTVTVDLDIPPQALAALTLEFATQ